MNRDIDTGRVIEEVRLRKCLWDASDIFYKNKNARLKAWNDIVIALFEDVQENEKNNLEKLIQQRWKTARDAFFRCKGSMRNTPSGSSAKKMKKYVYYDDLSFLHQTGVNIVIDSLSTNSDNSSTIIDTEDTSNMYTLENAEQRQLEQEQGSTQMPRPPKKRKRQPLQENSNFEKELLTLLRNQTPDIDNDDLAFFSSLGPVLKSFDLEQKLQFRSRVLAVAMDIQNIYPRANSSPTNYTTDNEAQGNDGTPSTYEEEYKPQMYHI
ncbi:uncharacterized protein LOC123686602 [Harmonia axyridis]|uniref:uncharacterized protein LOC123686602 n=1 Tax=Harmonia axyridis TaxID=115357 RepID=UPI001E277C13|nr:uncharacterized protein LOC123686602 [Harmonia axyridis]